MGRLVAIAACAPLASRAQAQERERTVEFERTISSLEAQLARVRTLKDSQ